MIEVEALRVVRPDLTLAELEYLGKGKEQEPECSDELNLEAMDLCDQSCDTECASHGGCKSSGWDLIDDCVVCNGKHKCNDGTVLNPFDIPEVSTSPAF